MFTGALVVGVLDGLDAMIFFGLRGAAPHRIFQSIASGILGGAAFQGGAATTVLGVVLHFLVAFLIVLTCFVLSGFLPVLVERPIAAGAAFGVTAYIVMNYVVIPLSAMARGGPPPWPVLINGVLIHVFGVGIPCAMFARRARLEAA